MRINKTIPIAIIAILLAGVATSCSSDPLSVTCGDYLKKGEAEQLDLAARWADPARNQTTDLDRIVAPEYRGDFMAYCPTHPDDELNNLELGFG
ncbi:MAG TPA: hypothetical protein VH333_26680 [Pseudonocardiaceae bacterium]|jgi:hypothetical protein|nr:hypothetical protein [Pseudonocardiaceae bacterium]